MNNQLFQDTSLIVNSKTWVRQHGSGELSFGRTLRNFFGQQADRIADAVADMEGITPDQTSLVFRVEDEHALLMPISRRNVSALMVRGAVDQLEEFDSRKTAEEIIPSDLPEDVRQEIARALEETLSQDYWREITNTIDADLKKIIQDGIDEKLNSYSISIRIREVLGGFEARRRALRIARTETTGALNAGHDASYQPLIEAGLMSGTKWLAIVDDRVRQSHTDLDGAVVPPRQPFSVGGFPAPYPGHWSLPAQERVFCRCTTLAVLNV